MSGWFDVLRRLLGWWNSPAATEIADQFYPLRGAQNVSLEVRGAESVTIRLRGAENVSLSLRGDQ